MSADRGPDWIEVRVLVPVGWEELVAGELALDGCTSVAFGRPNLAADAPPEGLDYVRTFYDVRHDRPAFRASIAARLTVLAERVGLPELEGLAPSFKPLPHEDWATSWKKSWRPFRVGRLAVVTRDWSGPSRPDDRRLTLEPGGAFGTGRHATTRLCLRAIQELELDGAHVLDAGCGTGILAVTAALFGAADVLGFDIDPRSEVEGRELAEVNGVGRRCRFRTGDFGVLGSDDAGFDLLLANIYSDVLQDQAVELRRRLRPGGRFVLSGCPDRHAAATLTAVAAAGLEVEETRRRGRWLAFLGQRP